MKTITLNEFQLGSDIERLREAVRYLRNHPKSRLVIPPGCYSVAEPEAISLQRRIMAGELGNNPEELLFTPSTAYSIGLDFSGVENAEIEATGALFLVDGFMETVSLQHCKNVKITGLNIDHRRKPYSKGVVVGGGSSYTDVRFENQPGVSERMPSPRIAVFNKQSRLIENIGSSSRKEQLSQDIIRFYGFVGGQVGDDIYVWHTFHFRPAIHIYEAENITLEDVTIHSQPGMGIVGHRSRDITMTHLKVVPSCGELMSTNTDATHFSSCSGFVKFDGCQFEGQGDDSTNVHGYYYTIHEAAGSRAVLSVEVPTHNCKLDYPSVGDRLELSVKDTLIPKTIYTVVDVKPDFVKHNCSVTLDKALPCDYSCYYLANSTALPRLEFINCFVRNHIARGVLVKTRGVRIENCMFSYNTGTAIHVAAEASWHEGITAEDVIIKNNRIIGSGHLDWGKIYDAGGISINILSKDPDEPVHKNILIEQNLIDCPQSKHAIYAANVDGLVIQNNELKSSDEPVVIRHCENVQIKNNR